ncbi:uncharacterized protein [Drosophila pseudoobscura]|uniref:Uncharacterized protein n=1 Tax=Drosophila pseudoobscura pseudoobscura TaxID=46245 RepID=A0A6I8W574_DROPS|nr:uncharacterized protein LOC117184511 [Drosophila pseudoobscura]
MACGCAHSSLGYTEKDRLIVTPGQGQRQQHPRQRRQVRLLQNSPSSDQSNGTLVAQRLINSGSSTKMKTLSSFISEHPEELAQQCRVQANPNAPGNGNGQQTTKWKSLRAVMAYYCSLRRIKRNVAH